MEKWRKMKNIFKSGGFLCKLYKIFKIFNHTSLHKKYFRNVLTKQKICAKIGIVKVFFINIGDNFHKKRIFYIKNVEK
jgi:hypothetical protein